MRLRTGRIERDGLVEAGQRLTIAVLILAQAAEIEDGQQEIRRERDRLLEQVLRLAIPPGLQGNQREQAQGVDIARVVAKDPAIEVLGLVGAPFLLVLRGQRHHAPLRGQRETLLECAIGLGATAEQSERLAEREPGVLEFRVEMRGPLQVGKGLLRAILPDEQVAEILMRLRKCRRLGDHLQQGRFGLGSAIQLYQQRAEERQHVDVARIAFERGPAPGFRRGELTRVDQGDYFVEYSFRYEQRAQGERLHSDNPGAKPTSSVRRCTRNCRVTRQPDCRTLRSARGPSAASRRRSTRSPALLLQWSWIARAHRPGISRVRRLRPGDCIPPCARV